MDEPDVDIQHARTLLEGELRDVTLALNSSPPEPEAFLLSDRAAALHYQLEEFQNEQLRQSDRRMQQSIYRAMLADISAVESLLKDSANGETAARRGREGPSCDNAALRVNGKDGYYEDPRINPSGSTQFDEYVNMLKLDESRPPQTCQACLDDVPYSQSVEVGACTHSWCRACLTQAFELALQSENHYPVRCCKDLVSISVDESAISKLLGDNFVADFKKKIIEYGTDDRTYCHAPTCSAFIDPDTIKDRLAVCPSCLTRTCSACKVAFHAQDQCQSAPDTAFEEWRTENHASICPRCGHTILISYGCNHMTYVSSITDSALFPAA
jgi:hypothetical protein